MPTEHLFTSAVADGGDATLVRPSDWNAIHVTPYAAGPFTLPTGNGAVQVDLLSLSGTELVTLEGTAVLVIT
jgi:acetaldehyde dehydrogenase (acetylating)